MGIIYGKRELKNKTSNMIERKLQDFYEDINIWTWMINLEKQA